MNSHDINPIEFGGEAPDSNYDRKLPVIFCLDQSGSMQAHLPEIEAAMQKMVEELKSDTTCRRRLEISIVSFGAQTEVSLPLTSIADDQFRIPSLVANGGTPMRDGILLAMDTVEKAKANYRNNEGKPHRPYICLITDGYPNSNNDPRTIAPDILAGVNGKHFHFWAFGTSSADFEMLKDISSPEFSPIELSKADWSSFFQWLSDSISEIGNSQPGDVLNLNAQDESGQFIQHQTS